MIKKLTVIFATLVLTACGGGGGGGGGGSSSAPSTPVTVPLLSSIANQITNGSTYSFAVSGYWSTESNTISGSVISDDFPATSSVISGISYLKQNTVEVGSATALNGTVINLGNDYNSYFNPSNYSRTFTDTNPFVVYSPYTYPSTITTGDAGSFANFTLYSTPAMITVTGSGTQSYEVLPNNSSSVILKITSNVFNTNSQKTFMTVVNYQLTTAGVITPIKFEYYRYNFSGETPYYIVYTKQ